MIGASLLWVGWFGFNAGSNLEANGTDGARLHQHLRRDGGRGAVLAVRRVGAPRASRRCSASRRARSPASCDHAGGRLRRPDGRDRPRPRRRRRLLRVRARRVKNALGYDDSLDVFGVHCVGGILGALATGILVNPGARRRRHRRLRHASRASWRSATYAIGDAGHGPGQGRAADPRLVRRRLRDPLQDRRPDRSACASRRKRSAKASTSPTTASAPTTTEAGETPSSRSRSERRGRRTRPKAEPGGGCRGLTSRSRSRARPGRAIDSFARASTSHQAQPPPAPLGASPRVLRHALRAWVGGRSSALLRRRRLLLQALGNGRVDGVENHLHFVQHLVVPEAQHAIACVLERRGAPLVAPALVVEAVLRAIDLEREARSPLGWSKRAFAQRTR